MSFRVMPTTDLLLWNVGKMEWWNWMGCKRGHQQQGVHLRIEGNPDAQSATRIWHILGRWIGE